MFAGIVQGVVVQIITSPPPSSLTFVDLVNDTERILNDICNFLDIKFLKDRMLEGPKYNFVYPQESIKKRES